MLDEKIFHEYANLKLDNETLIKELLEIKSVILERFSHVIEVADYYYDKLIDDEDFNEDDFGVFSIAYMYLEEQIFQIKDLLKNIYKNKISDLEKHAKEINLLLNTFDFQSEAINHEFEQDDDVKALLEFDKDIYEMIENNRTIPDSKYQELDDLTYRIFNKNNRNYYSISSIFYDIADELEII